MDKIRCILCLGNPGLLIGLVTSLTFCLDDYWARTSDLISAWMNIRSGLLLSTLEYFNASKAPYIGQLRVRKKYSNNVKWPYLKSWNWDRRGLWQQRWRLLLEGRNWRGRFGHWRWSPGIPASRSGIKYSFLRGNEINKHKRLHSFDSASNFSNIPIFGRYLFPIIPKFENLSSNFPISLHTSIFHNLNALYFSWNKDTMISKIEFYHTGRRKGVAFWQKEIIQKLLLMQNWKSDFWTFGKNWKSDLRKFGFFSMKKKQVLR